MRSVAAAENSDDGGTSMLQQISIFAENRRGMMKEIAGALASEQINILGSVTNDSAEYGIVRMIVSDADRAYKVLTDMGCLCKLTKVIGVEITDEPGMLHKLLSAIHESYININYMYLSYNRDSGKPIIILHTEDVYEVEDALSGKGFTVKS